MSLEDGLVMQIHPGSRRNHNRQVFQRFGRDVGADIPTPTELCPRAAAAAGALWQRGLAHHHPLHPGRIHLQPRAGAPGGALPLPSPGASVVVLRQPRRHDALSRADHGDRGFLQHSWVSTTIRGLFSPFRPGTTWRGGWTVRSWRDWWPSTSWTKTRRSRWPMPWPTTWPARHTGCKAGQQAEGVGFRGTCRS